MKGKSAADHVIDAGFFQDFQYRTVKMPRASTLVINTV
jgi:hypothetical protein